VPVSAPQVAGIVLAAGGSRRLGTAKQLLRDDTGLTLVERSVQLLRDAGCSPVVVVTGAQRADVSAAVTHQDVALVHNAAWEEGMASSIRTAIHALSASEREAASPSAALIVACDMPSVSVAHLQCLLERSSEGHRRVASAYTAASNAGDREILIQGIPALFPRADWPQLLALRGDRGARQLCSEPDTVTVTLPNGHVDIDAPADVVQWRRSFSSADPPETR